MATELVTVEAAQEQALNWPKRAESLQVVDQESHDTATGWLKDIKAAKDFLTEYHDPIIKSAYATHKIATTTKQRFYGPLVQSEITLKQRVGTFVQEQQRKQAEAQRKVEEAARKREEENRIAEAERLEAAGGTEEQIDQTLTAPSTAPKPVAAPTYQQTKGVSTRSNWKGEVEDFRALVNAVAQGKAPITFLEPNQSTINQMAKAQKGQMLYPGIRFYNDAVVSVRS